MTGQSPVSRITASRLVYALYIFAPVSAFFLLPLIFYRAQIVYFPSAQCCSRVEVGGLYVFSAVVAVLVWLAVAVGIILWPSARDAAPPRPWSSRALWSGFVILSVLGSAVSIVHSFVRVPLAIEEIVSQAALAPILGAVLGIYVLRSLPPATALFRKGLVWGLLGLDLVVAVGIPIFLARIAPAAFGVIAILYGLSALGGFGRRQLFVAALLLPIILVSFPLKELLRERVYGHGASQRATVMGAPSQGVLFTPPKVTFFQRMDDDPWVIGFWFHRTGNRVLLPLQFGLTRVLDRINRLRDLAYVIQTTPSSIPYAGGVTYAPLVGKLIPRFLWHDSPQERAGQFYGHRYGFIEQSDTVSSTNLPMVTEGWVNGGWWGIIVSAVFVGVLLRLIWTYWVGGSGAPGNVIIGMAVVGIAVDGESNLSGVMGGAIHALLIFWIVEVAIRSWGRRAS